MTTRLGDLPSLAVRRPTLIVVLNLLIIVAGLSALLGVEVRELPDVDRPWVSVRAFFEGASPETMDAEVTSVIEAAVARVAGVREISSASEEDNSRIWAQFAPNVNIDVAANDVREAVAGVERRLPKGVDDIVVVKADTNARPIIRLALRSSHLSQEALTYLAEEDVKPELTAIPGVAMVNLFGERRRVLRVIVDPMRLASYHLSIDDISRVLRSTDMDVPAGSFKSEDQLLLVRADASLWQPKDVERLAIN
ncbi:MAG: Multidrug resistance protein MdtC, partial [Alphaproteobacteria bacterium MarineAlpha1_Bin1]